MKSFFFQFLLLRSDEKIIFLISCERKVVTEFCEFLRYSRSYSWTLRVKLGLYRHVTAGCGNGNSNGCHRGNPFVCRLLINHFLIFSPRFYTLTVWFMSLSICNICHAPTSDVVLLSRRTHIDRRQKTPVSCPHLLSSCRTLDWIVIDDRRETAYRVTRGRHERNK